MIEENPAGIEPPAAQIDAPTRHRLKGAAFARPSLLWVSGLCWLGVAVLILLVRTNSYLPFDDAIDRWIQSLPLGPLSAPFRFFSWAGGPGAAFLVSGALVLVVLTDHRAWLLGVLSVLGGGWYWILVGFVHRPRPTLDQVIRITEHPGSSSFPSGHVIFITISLCLVMLGIGHRHLPPMGRWLGWVITAGVVLLAAISRVYVGAHWPTDALAGVLIAVAWLSLIASVRPISDPALGG